MPANSVCFRDAAVSPMSADAAVAPQCCVTTPDTPPAVRLTFCLKEPQSGPIPYRRRNHILHAIERSIAAAHAERDAIEVVFEDAGAVDPIFLRQCIHAARAASGAVHLMLGGDGEGVSGEYMTRMMRDVGIFLDPGAFVIGAAHA